MNTTNNTLSATKFSLQSALIANQQLQNQIEKELKIILERKKHNRNAAVQCIKGLGVPQERETTEEKKKKRREAPPTEEDVAALFNESLSYKRRRLFRYDPNRRWTFEFWTDPTGSRPSDNQDTITRQRLMEKLKFGPTPTSSDAKRNFRPFSQQESEQILQYISQHDPPDWYTLAFQMKDRTAMECLHYFHALQRKEKQGNEGETDQQPPWERHQELTLLQYLALQGPQFVMDKNSASQIEDLIGKNKFTVKQILHKTNSTKLVDPRQGTKSNRHMWDIDEERKLALAMKVYSESTGFPSPEHLAALHFPTRPNSYVSRKWKNMSREIQRKPAAVMEKKLKEESDD